MLHWPGKQLRASLSSAYLAAVQLQRRLRLSGAAEGHTARAALGEDDGPGHLAGLHEMLLTELL